MFPDDFPEDCPPDIAEKKEVQAYRFSNNLILNGDDFKSYEQLGIKPRYPDPLYKSYGVSLFLNHPIPIEELKQFSTITKKYKYIHYGITLSQEGLIYIEHQKQHLTWWLYKDKYPHQHFKLDKTIDE